MHKIIVILVAAAMALCQADEQLGVTLVVRLKPDEPDKLSPGHRPHHFQLDGHQQDQAGGLGAGRAVADTTCTPAGRLARPEPAPRPAAKLWPGRPRFLDYVQKPVPPHEPGHARADAPHDFASDRTWILLLNRLLMA